MFVVFAKVQPFLKQLRDRTHNPEFMANVEQLILNSKEARDRLRDASKRINHAQESSLSLSETLAG